jgi:hypothetical protein
MCILFRLIICECAMRDIATEQTWIWQVKKNQMHPKQNLWLKNENHNLKKLPLQKPPKKKSLLIGIDLISFINYFCRKKDEKRQKRKKSDLHLRRQHFAGAWHHWDIHSNPAHHPAVPADCLVLRKKFRLAIQQSDE